MYQYFTFIFRTEFNVLFTFKGSFEELLQLVSYWNSNRKFLGSRSVGWAVLGHHVTERWHWCSEACSSYSPGVVDADYSLSPPKTVCAWWKATSYERWACCAEHSGSKGVNLEKQSPILRCECRSYGMNGCRWVCLKRHPLGYQTTSQK
jgi:hypothetical protein